MRTTSSPRLLVTVALLTLVAFATVILSLAGCAARPEIRSDQDPAVDLRSYRTFAFYEPLGTDRMRYSTILSARLKQATRSELERQQYIYSEEHPDLRVNLIVQVADKQELRSAPGRPGLGYRAWAGSIETVNYRQGTLSIELVDPRRNALVWQGVAEGRIDPAAADGPQPAVDATVRAIFAKFAAAVAKS